MISEQGGHNVVSQKDEQNIDKTSFKDDSISS